MSRIYDNWERLVAAVIRREQLWQLFHEQSRSPSICSESSSFSFRSDDVSFPGAEKVQVTQKGKSVKELTALYKDQEIQAHNGPIWTIKFSLDGKYLASAGEDCVVHVWQVIMETERRGDFYFESSVSGKSRSVEQVLVPETLFALSEKPVCSFEGHLVDVQDLSWSKSQQLLSSSMDKTVRLWDLSTKTCLKIFLHFDYVTCIQFNPVDDRYFISGSVDAMTRIWSIPDQRVVDYTDLHEIITAISYTPDGQGALVGSYSGKCHIYNISSDNLLQERSQIILQNRKKITGLQFATGSTSKVLMTSADSETRLVDGVRTTHRFRGFDNTNSQICASLTSNRKHVVSASKDSRVYVWRHEDNRRKGGIVSESYEYFHCEDVTVAIPWPCLLNSNGGVEHLKGLSKGFDQSKSPAWGMVIVAAGLRGEITTFQNFGLPMKKP